MAIVQAARIKRPEVVLRNREASKRWRKLNPQRSKDTVRCATLRKKYGISSADYEKLLEEQGGVCAICGSTESKVNTRLHVDHDHSSGKIRGILCQPCNVTLGKMQERPDLLRKAADYLEKNLCVS